MLLSTLLAATAGAGEGGGDKAKAQAHYKRANVYYTLNKFDDAIVEFEEAFKEYPEPVFLFNIAQAHRLARRPEQALDFYKKFLRLMPVAPNRKDVEKQIAALEQTIQHGASMSPVDHRPEKTGPTTKNEPMKSEPVKSEPVKTTKAEPVKSEPVKSEPVKTTKAEPVKTTKAEPVKATKAEPVKSEPVKSEPMVTAPNPLVTPPPSSSGPAPRKMWPVGVGVGVAVVVVAAVVVPVSVVMSRPSEPFLAVENAR